MTLPVIDKLRNHPSVVANRERKARKLLAERKRLTRQAARELHDAMTRGQAT
jgi:glucose-6-phosphate-specific signal transduction histidine kinase